MRTLVATIFVLITIDVLRNVNGSKRELSRLGKLEADRMRSWVESYELLHGPPDG